MRRNETTPGAQPTAAHEVATVVTPGDPSIPRPPDPTAPFVLVVGDQTMVTVALAQSLASTELMETVALPFEAEAVLDAAAAHDRAIVLLDVDIEPGAARELVVALRSAQPEMRIVALGSDVDPVGVAALVGVGAGGFLLKSQTLDSLVAAIADVDAGRPVFAPAMMGALLEHLATSTAPPTLSDRQRRILEMLAVGTDTRQMATDLHLTLNTMRNQIRSVMVRLGAHSKLEAVAIGLRNGLISAPLALPTGHGQRS